MKPKKRKSPPHRVGGSASGGKKAKKKKLVKKKKPKAKKVSKSATKRRRIEQAQKKPKGKKPTVSEKKIPAPKSAAKPKEHKRRHPDLEDDVESEITLDKTPMRIYLQQIETIPLLTPEEEISLSQTIAEGTDEDAAHARNKMIRSNLRLVISIAKRYSNLGLPFSDLVEEGNIGLMRAVDKFNYARGYRFSTYASWWIKQAIMRSLSNQGKTIRVPVYMYDTISKYRKMRESLIQQNSRIPTRKEIADAMEIPVAKVKELERIASQPSSLNAPISLDGQAEIIDIIQDENAAKPDQTIEELFEGQRIEHLLKMVDERERQILVLRFGLQGGEPHTLEETAKHFNVTRERIRQIEMAAIAKIRHLIKEKSEKLEDYVR